MHCCIINPWGCDRGKVTVTKSAVRLNASVLTIWGDAFRVRTIIMHQLLRHDPTRIYCCCALTETVNNTWCHAYHAFGRCTRPPDGLLPSLICSLYYYYYLYNMYLFQLTYSVPTWQQRAYRYYVLIVQQHTRISIMYPLCVM